MAIDYTSLFEDIGKLIFATNKIAAAATSGVGADYPTTLAAIRTVFESNSSQHVIEGVQQIFDNSRDQVAQQAQRVADLVTRRLLDRDTVLNELNIDQPDINALFVALFRDMLDVAQDVNASAPTIGTPDLSDSTGDGKVLAIGILDGVSPPSPGLPANIHYHNRSTELIDPDETIVFDCIQDEGSGRLEGQEIFRVTSAPRRPNRFGWRTEGMGLNTTITTNAAGEILSNGEMETFSSNVPAGWSIVSGTAGVNIFEEAAASNVHRGNLALKLTTAGEIKQLVDQGEMDGARMYALSAALKKGAPTTGTLVISLESPSGAWTPDAAEIITIADVSTLTTSYVIEARRVLMPKLVPSDLEFVIRLTGADDSVYVDSVSLAPMIYLGGVAYALFPGATQWRRGDRITVRNQSLTPGVIQEFFRRQFGVQLASVSDASETIPDSLAT